MNVRTGSGAVSEEARLHECMSWWRCNQLRLGSVCMGMCVCVCTKALGALSQVKVDVFAQEGDSAFSSFLAFCVSFKVSVACWKVPSYDLWKRNSSVLSSRGRMACSKSCFQNISRKQSHPGFLLALPAQFWEAFRSAGAAVWRDWYHTLLWWRQRKHNPAGAGDPGQQHTGANLEIQNNVTSTGKRPCRFLGCIRLIKCTLDQVTDGQLSVLTLRLSHLLLETAVLPYK